MPKPIFKTLHLSHTALDCYCFDESSGAVGRPIVYLTVDADTKLTIGAHISLNKPSSAEAIKALNKSSAGKGDITHDALVDYGCCTVITDSPTIQPNSSSIKEALNNSAGNTASDPRVSLHSKAMVEKYFNTLPHSGSLQISCRQTGKNIPKISLEDLTDMLVSATKTYNA
ncbi:hypothetical protein [Endozoicomonas euniceicola]|uniref:Uncharacterized protein n=1 Tax=Endozoicomonas euniceicola TaxID=1234143 RepID=A0ABY6GR74_9GAMM|nr:hypothetical protein [Endozoicomonas euniceicola]UYM14904.1 hypothetical protein NX720_18720 [Endozoicomonas euniceicola]